MPFFAVDTRPLYTCRWGERGELFVKGGAPALGNGINPDHAPHSRHSSCGKEQEQYPPAPPTRFRLPEHQKDGIRRKQRAGQPIRFMHGPQRILRVPKHAHFIEVWKLLVPTPRRLGRQRSPNKRRTRQSPPRPSQKADGDSKRSNLQYRFEGNPEQLTGPRRKRIERPVREDANEAEDCSAESQPSKPVGPAIRYRTLVHAEVYFASASMRSSLVSVRRNSAPSIGSGDANVFPLIWLVATFVNALSAFTIVVVPSSLRK
jgi:hypothetical protein